MEDFAARMKIDWATEVVADAAKSGTTDAENLRHLVSATTPLLLTNLGLLTR